MIQRHRLKNVGIFFQTILSFALSAKIKKINNMLYFLQKKLRTFVIEMMVSDEIYDKTFHQMILGKKTPPYAETRF